MRQIGFLRKINSIIPFFLVKFFYNSIAILRYKVKIGRGSLVRPGCHFAGNNVIMTNSEVAYSRLGKYTYVANQSVIRFTDIGAFCSLGDNIRTCLGQHPTNFKSTHPQTYSSTPPSGDPWVSMSEFSEHKYIDEKKRYVVKIGNDVWIGNNVLIMDGVTIADGAIVAAGSIVTKDVTAYSIVAGTPAKEVRKRFAEDKIESLLKEKWWDRPDDWIKANLDSI